MRAISVSKFIYLLFALLVSWAQAFYYVAPEIAESENSVLPSSSNEEIIVKTKNGKIRGQVETFPSGFRANLFFGIRYSKPAVRYAKAEPPEAWPGVINATAWGATCPQTYGSLYQSEDCLYLNVFAPNKPIYLNQRKSLYPVMLYIHGGGWMSGSSTYYGYSRVTQAFAAKGVVVVTINYRLSSFGFVSTGDDVAPGNYGLWDQALALQWTAENIEAFGGDPRQITIFGTSAGGAAVSLLTLSPASYDLFQQAICHSGSPYAFNQSLSDTPVRSSRALAKALNCPVMSSVKMIKCLRTKTQQEILNITKTYPMNTFEPRIDGQFFPDSIESLYEKAPPKPFIGGTCSLEMGGGDWQGGRDINISSFSIDEFRRRLELWAPAYKFERPELIYDVATHYYLNVFDNELGDPENKTFLVQQYIRLLDDLMFVVPASLDARQRLRNGWPVWLYWFDYYINSTIYSPFRGAYHGTDVMFEFDVGPQLTPEDLRMVEVYTTLLTNFAKFGYASFASEIPQFVQILISCQAQFNFRNPTPMFEGNDSNQVGDDNSAGLNDDFIWQKLVNDGSANFARINTIPEMRDGFGRTETSLWGDLVPLIDKMPLADPAPR